MHSSSSPIHFKGVNSLASFQGVPLFLVTLCKPSFKPLSVIHVIPFPKLIFPLIDFGVPKKTTNQGEGKRRKTRTPRGVLFVICSLCLGFGDVKKTWKITGADSRYSNDDISPEKKIDSSSTMRFNCYGYKIEVPSLRMSTKNHTSQYTLLCSKSMLFKNLFCPFSAWQFWFGVGQSKETHSETPLRHDALEVSREGWVTTQSLEDVSTDPASLKGSKSFTWCLCHQSSHWSTEMMTKSTKKICLDILFWRKSSDTILKIAQKLMLLFAEVIVKLFNKLSQKSSLPSLFLCDFPANIGEKMDWFRIGLEHDFPLISPSYNLNLFVVLKTHQRFVSAVGKNARGVEDKYLDRRRDGGEVPLEIYRSIPLYCWINLFQVTNDSKQYTRICWDDIFLQQKLTNPTK